MLTLETALRLAGIPAVLLSVFYWAVVIPGAIGMTVAWCVLLRKAGVPWGFHFIPFFGDFCHFRIARGVDLFITKWCVIGGTLTAALIQLLNQGAGQISQDFGVNNALPNVIIGIVLFFIIGSEFFINYEIHFRRSGRKESAGRAVK